MKLETFRSSFFSFLLSKKHITIVLALAPTALKVWFILKFPFFIYLSKHFSHVTLVREIYERENA
ncbi:hypothetical protein CYK11_07365 [Streptococcus anginosus]|uniref:Uncharacterized protein n=1 Tax=Streptococcus anginosus TaxID=1328 RepID=A0A413KM65_STRAP|nr:hypothetical protein F6I38_08835 [Streptococcus anginosus]KAB0645678.1 hypothetical protein F6I01_10320 [Aerococcus sanguinicola]KAA9248177.1 hypothetical protein F6I32_05280 [Streptococcus anginosus]KAA9254068.1 hypothetical protein F6I28_07265 [Streptococcus anginosus]KAA9259725.1 hypothetical protein F6I23_07375 [Streptococcus anginosus]